MLHTFVSLRLGFKFFYAFPSQIRLSFSGFFLKLKKNIFVKCNFLIGLDNFRLVLFFIFALGLLKLELRGNNSHEKLIQQLKTWHKQQSKAERTIFRLIDWLRYPTHQSKLKNINCDVAIYVF